MNKLNLILAASLLTFAGTQSFAQSDYYCPKNPATDNSCKKTGSNVSCSTVSGLENLQGSLNNDNMSFFMIQYPDPKQHMGETPYVKCMYTDSTNYSTLIAVATSQSVQINQLQPIGWSLSDVYMCSSDSVQCGVSITESGSGKTKK